MVPMTKTVAKPHVVIKPMMKAHQIATQFASFIQLHIVSIEDKNIRHKMVQFCVLAWNVSLFPDASQRETQIETAWNVIKSDSIGSPLPEREHRFKKELKNLIMQKLYLFPYATHLVLSAQMVVIEGRAWIRVNTDVGFGKAPLAAWLDVKQFPAVIDVLRNMGKATHERLMLMESLRYKTPAISKEFIDGMIYTFCLQRSNLYWYQLLIEVWQQQTHPKYRHIIGRWLHFIEKLDNKTLSLLACIDKIIPYNNDQIQSIAILDSVLDAKTPSPV